MDMAANTGCHLHGVALEAAAEACTTLSDDVIGSQHLFNVYVHLTADVHGKIVFVGFGQSCVTPELSLSHVFGPENLGKIVIDEINITSLNFYVYHIICFIMSASIVFMLAESLLDEFWRPYVIQERVHTEWGTHSLIEATRYLLWQAFRDPVNQRFVLISESDLPIWDPLTFYEEIMSEKRSKVDAWWHPEMHKGRWSMKMVR